jgi:hypothetical protein
MRKAASMAGYVQKLVGEYLEDSTVAHPILPRILARVIVVTVMAGHWAPAGAQTVLSLSDLGRLVDATLDVVLPAGDSLSRVSVEQRGIFFDHSRSLASFRQTSRSGEKEEIPLHRIAKNGSRALLADCNEIGNRGCELLGWSAYVWIEALSISATEARVRAHVLWPSRSGEPFEAGIKPRSNGILTMFFSDVYLARDANGRWKFSRMGRTVSS